MYINYLHIYLYIYVVCLMCKCCLHIYTSMYYFVYVLWLTQWLSCPTVNHFGTPANGP